MTENIPTTHDPLRQLTRRLLGQVGQASTGLTIARPDAEKKKRRRYTPKTGVIHTDLERGFIRAEVIAYDELVSAGSMEAAKQHGKVRVEGKDYVVAEGDILHVRFAV